MCQALGKTLCPDSAALAQQHLVETTWAPTLHRDIPYSCFDCTSDLQDAICEMWAEDWGLLHHGLGAMHRNNAICVLWHEDLRC